jgi:hypothetical protein
MCGLVTSKEHVVPRWFSSVNCGDCLAAIRAAKGGGRS